MTPRNRYAEAFKENFNVVSLAGAVALAAALTNPIVLLPALVLEAAYLIFVPDSSWYTRRLALRHDAEIEAHRAKIKAEILPTLRPDLQRRFLRLEDLRKQIGTLAMDEQTWFREVLRKLDYLLDKFLQFAGKEVQFRAYLASILSESRGEIAPNPVAQFPQGTQRTPNTTRRASWIDDAFAQNPPDHRSGQRRSRNGATSSAAGPAGRNKNAAAATNSSSGASLSSDRWVQEAISEVQSHYDEEMQSLRALADKESDDGTRAVLEKRCEVLQRRREFVGKMGRILQNLNHQLELLEDTFGLISDEIRARPPDQVLADIEDVVTQTQTMTQVLEEIAPYEQSLARMAN